MESEATAAAIAREKTNRTGKYLTFLLSNESYGVDVLKVREIIRFLKITPVPQMPAYVKGVINLRGKVLPVIDLRLKFGMPACAATDQTCIIVVEAAGDSRTAMMGLLVDGVSEVLNIQAAEIEPPPAFGDGVRTDYMQGVAKVKGTVKILLDIDRVLTGTELDALAA